MALHLGLCFHFGYCSIRFDYVIVCVELLATAVLMDMVVVM